MLTKKQSESLGASAAFGAILGAASVYIGEFAGWPKFNVREGYLGVEFLATFLYALGHDTIAMAIVAVIWAVYGALAFSILTFPILLAGNDC